LKNYSNRRVGRMNIAKLHKKVMKEFEINKRDYFHQCFEGSYIWEIVEFVSEEKKKELEE